MPKAIKDRICKSDDKIGIAAMAILLTEKKA
jgi:hypothetical protein